MREVWKYQFPITGEFALTMKVGAEILHVESQRGIPSLWASVDPEADLERRLFSIVGTGHPTNLVAGQHVASFFQLDGGLVWHLFERKP